MAHANLPENAQDVLDVPLVLRERTLLSGWICYPVTMLAIAGFVWLSRYDGLSWWLLVSLNFSWLLVLGFAMGLAQENPWNTTHKIWRQLSWRLVLFQTLYFATQSLMFHVSLAFGLSHANSGRWHSVLVFVLLFSFILYWSGFIVLRFLCPKCSGLFFHQKSVSGSELIRFGMKKWPNTCCQNCGWLLWKPIEERGERMGRHRV